MSLPGIFEPSGLTPFLAAGLGIDPEDLYSTDAKGTGHSRKRRLFTTAPQRVSVARLLTPEQAVAYEDWYETTIVVAETHFVAWVSNLGPGQLYFDACWLEPPQWQPIATKQGIHWRLTGELLLTGSGVVERPLDGALAVEFVAALTGSAVVVGETLLAVEYSAALVPTMQLAVEYLAELESAGPVEASFRLREAGDFRLREGGGKRKRESDYG